MRLLRAYLKLRWDVLQDSRIVRTIGCRGIGRACRLALVAVSGTNLDNPRSG